MLEDAGVDEIAEGLVVEVVTGKFGVFGHHIDDYLEQVGIALELGRVAVRIMDSIDKRFAFRKKGRELLDLRADGVSVLPFDASVESVEVLDYF